MMSARPVVLASILSLTAVFFAGGCASDKHAMTPAQPAGLGLHQVL